jgi:nifR3 family TIM-barrel protein
MVLKRSFKIGSLELLSNVIYAPLAGCSDLPFRAMSVKYGPGLVFCEMVKMDALIRNDIKTYQLLAYEHNQHPIGAQLCGSKKELAKTCGRILEDLGFDLIDLNCGCPVDKVTKDGSGSGLLKNPEQIGEILNELVSSVSVPVTLKIRTGWDEASINCVTLTQLAEKAGAKAIFIHGRTRAQGYKGFANRDLIKEAKAHAKTIKVIGNGDIFDAKSAKHMFDYTECDGILVSRGTMGAPWICQDIYHFYETGIMPEPSFRRALLGFIEHFNKVLEFHNEKKAVLDARRVGCWYLKDEKNIAQFRKRIATVKNTQEVFGIIEEMKEQFLFHSL